MDDSQSRDDGSGVSRREVLAVAVASVATALPIVTTGCGEAQEAGEVPVSDGGAEALPDEMELVYSSAAASARRIRAGAISSEDLVRLYLERIEEVNPTIRAVVALADDALEQARQADLELARGHSRGPLHGVPMTIKDCFDTEGVVSSWGTLGRKDFVPSADATVVARLREAGAILLGKTNTPEFTLSFETWNRVHGFTNNPWDITRSPGGSSGGAAALLAAGGTAFDIGTDLGGSVRVPSHCCGTVGLKPTSGSVPRTGICLPPGLLNDRLSHVGPMARRVEDLALLFPLIAGPDGVDSRIAPAHFRGHESVEVRGLRCAVMTDNGIVTPDPATIATVEAAASLMREAGAEVRPDVLPVMTEVAQLGTDFWRLGGLAAVIRLLAAAGTGPEDWANNWYRQALEQGSQEVATSDIVDHLNAFEGLRRRALEFMSDYDVLLSPVNAHPAQPHPEPGESPFPIEDASYTVVFDQTGWPSGVLRGGTSPEGLPIGVQVTANPWREDVVLAVMAQLEEGFGDFPRPQIVDSQ